MTSIGHVGRILAVGLILFCRAAAPAGAAGNGDVNGDGVFNATDLTLTSHHILGKAQLSAGQISKADVNGDSTVDVADAVVMANWLNNKITIDVTPDTASWVLTGPAGFAAVSGSGDRLGSNAVKIAPTGSYYLHCAPVSGYISPLDSATSFTAGGTLELKPWYSRLDMCGVQASAFTMGRTDAESTAADELPRHTVMLSPYEIGKYEVTVSQFCKVVNWAYTRHYLDTGYDLYVNRYLYARVGKDTVTVLGQNFQIDCVNNVFYPGYQDGRQLGSYPVYCVTWQGAVLFCNWLSEKEGLTPCYDLGTWTLKSPCPNGYRLPTEAEWERAAAWDGTRHRVYGMIADAVPDSSRCNFARKNPMGATSDPFPSPVGWFNGSNTSPNGSVKTVDSPSPVGCYDMSGNADEWCYDWYGAYGAAVQVNPTGPATGSYRIQRGGSWSTPKESIRTAYRGPSWFNAPYSSQGFRLVRSVQPVAYTAVVSPLAPDAVLPNGKVATTAFVSGPTTGTISYHWITRKPNGSDDDSGTRTVAMSGGCALVPPYDGFPTDAVGQYQVMLRVTAPVATESDAQRYSVAEIPAVYVALQSVATGTFTIGRGTAGDDAYGDPNELPRHAVTLSAYMIGKYEITNGQLCAVLNWAYRKGYLANSTGYPYGGGSVYAGGRLIAGFNGLEEIVFSDGAFAPTTRTGVGAVSYSTETHPAVNLTWYGCVAFCNWLSEKEGFAPCYDLSTWSLKSPCPNGYRLPTEAEWERAAAWSGSKHYVYGMKSDALTAFKSCNWFDVTAGNPFGFAGEPYTSPVGWFNGTNISPNGNFKTINSPSPAGCYDMSGNVKEWCYDWYADYTADAQTNPSGPAGGTSRLYRGGGYMDHHDCRTACRKSSNPDSYAADLGLRVARTK